MSRLIMVLLLSLLFSGTALAQSQPTNEMFSPEQVIHGITISRSQCAILEKSRSAVWVTTKQGNFCMRYYAAGLKAQNPIVAVWLHGDVMGGPTSVRHQSIGVRYMIEHMHQLSERYGVPFVFLARPGAYGSTGKNITIMHTPAEVEAIDAELNALKQLYGVRSWAIGGHSGGGTLAAELLAQRTDLRCVVLSSGAAAYRARLVARGFTKRLHSRNFFDPYDAIGAIPVDPQRVVITVGDPRDENVLFSTQQLYFESLRRRGLNAFLLPLRKGMPSEYHDLMDFGETALGMCAQGQSQTEITAALQAMPEQKDRPTN